MKKIGLFLIIGLVWLGALAQAPHPALCHKSTNEPYPAFFSIQPPYSGLQPGDWVGVYSDKILKCFGAEALNEGNFPGYGDDPETEKLDGFTQGEVMYPFMYSALEGKFYKLHGIFTDYRKDVVIDFMHYGPLSVYRISNASRGAEIQLSVDADLAKVVFNFIAPEIPIITGGSDAVKMKFEHQNTTDPTFILTTGKGTIEKRWDGHYYKYAATDAAVIINAVGRNNFTGDMLSAKLTLQLDQSAQSNAIFQDENIMFFLKNNEVWVKCKTQQITFALYRMDNGVEKKSAGWFSLRQGDEKKLMSNYSRSWKGAVIRMEYKIRQGSSFSGITEKTFTL